MDRLAKSRLEWKCRRGLLELDLVLQGFLQGKFTEEDAETLNELLDLPDNDLWDIVSGRRDDYDARFGGIVARLRAV
jgi:succinate dehydrogenase flavin-adding protein (antitoxin of CptAB toxin-antitoxin module)